MAIPFSYCPVKISYMEEIHEDLFNVKAGEFVVVYAPIVFRTLLYDPILLGNTINVIKNLKPHILVNSEIEEQHNSPCFASRFVEGLFYSSAYFDSLEVMLPDRNDLRRTKFEEACCGKEISNMLACEGKYRRVRHVKMDMWRSFFRQSGFKEKSFSVHAWCQARFLLKQYNHGENFTIEPNGSAITLGWKGTQLHTISLWSISRKRNR
ncbi:DELLA protein RGL1-like [Cryptomeria japonica]|uniref:DELLA protein RGL1-like n=1 Tax=Cryptomeria japonica TaxID=3369 RepID=UPI0025AD9899|nr:DELLA protein RGL1-like [Cryptomeria japonica]XP_057813303.1 DELLA protein RGL1-like [Cryptomeria japonica]